VEETTKIDSAINDVLAEVAKAEATTVKSPKRVLPPRKLSVKEDKSPVKSPKKANIELAKPKVISPSKVFEIDPDPSIEPLDAFKQSDIEFMLRIKDQYSNMLAKGEDALSVGSVTSSELTSAIPPGKMINIDLGDSNPETVVNTLASYGGNPRLYTPVPLWLVPYLEGARVKPDEVEMPSREEIRNHLIKKSKSKKRGAGWDIVVEWVPTGPQPKKSKLEKQLGFDNDSAFGNVISNSGGRRNRRPNQRYCDGAQEEEEEEKTETVSSTPTCSVPSETLPAPVPSTPVPVTNKALREIVKEEVEDEETSVEKGTSENFKESNNSTVKVAGISAIVKTTPKHVKKEKVVMKEAVKISVKNNIEDTEVIKDTSFVTRNSTEIIEEESSLALDNDTRAIDDSCVDVKTVVKVLDAEISATDDELNNVLRNLRGKRKRSSSGEAFHGWGAPPVVPRTGYSLWLNLSDVTDGIEDRGATFGLDKDLPLLSGDHGLEQGQLAVVMSPPVAQDIKKVEREISQAQENRQKPKVALPDSDQDERGSHSPSSFGSAKENVPEMCNTVASKFIQRAPLGINKRRRSLKNPVLKTNTVT